MDSNFREKDLKLDLLMNETDSAYFEFNFITQELSSSESFSKFILGKSFSEQFLQEETSLEIVHIEDLEKLKSFFDDIKKGKDRTENELRLKMADGSYHWCKLMAVTQKDSDGQLLKVTGIIIDFNLNHENGIVIRSLMTQISGGIIVYRNAEEQTKYSFFSNGFANILGYTNSEMHERLKDQNIGSLLFLKTGIDCLITSIIPLKTKSPSISWQDFRKRMVPIFGFRNQPT
ncbi:MAG: PAS domain-containing protein [Bacilli bacterium]